MGADSKASPVKAGNTSRGGTGLLYIMNRRTEIIITQVQGVRSIYIMNMRPVIRADPKGVTQHPRRLCTCLIEKILQGMQKSLKISVYYSHQVVLFESRLDMTARI